MPFFFILCHSDVSAEVPVLMSYFKHASWLGNATLTSSDCFVYLKEVKYLTRLKCSGVFSLAAP